MVNSENKPQKRKIWKATPEMRAQFKRDLLMSVPFLIGAGLTSFALLNGYHDFAVWFNNVNSNIPLIGHWAHAVNTDGLTQGLASFAQKIPGSEFAAEAIRSKQQEILPQLNNFISKEGILAAESAATLAIPARLMTLGVRGLARRATNIKQQVEALTEQGKQDEVPKYAKPFISGSEKTSLALSLGLTALEVGAELLAIPAGGELPVGPNDMLALGQAVIGKHPLIGKLKFWDRMVLFGSAAAPGIPADLIFSIYALIFRRINPDVFLKAKLSSAKPSIRRTK